MGGNEETAALGAEVASAVLTPLRFLERSAYVWRDRPAVVDGERAWTFAEHDERVRVPLNPRLAADEYAYIIEHSGAKVVVAHRPLEKALTPAIEKLGDAAP